MPLQKQIITLPLAIGQQDDIAEKVAEPSSAQLVDNYSFDLSGALSKRFGSTISSTNTDDATSSVLGMAHFIAPANSGAILGANGRVFPVSDTSRARPAGPFSPSIPDLMPVTAAPADANLGSDTLSEFEVVDTAVIYASDLIGIVGIEGGDFVFVRQEISTGNIIRQDRTTSSNIPGYARVVAIGSQFFVMYAEIDNGFVIYETSTDAFGALSSIYTVAAANYGTVANFAAGDAKPDMTTDGTDIFVAYLDNVNDLEVRRINTSGTLQSSNTLTTSSAATLAGLSIGAYSFGVVVAYTEALGGGPSNLTAFWSGNISTLVTRYGPTAFAGFDTYKVKANLAVFEFGTAGYEVAFAIDANGDVELYGVTSGGSHTLIDTVADVALAGGAYSYADGNDELWYLYLYRNSTLYPRLYLYNVTKAFPGDSGTRFLKPVGNYMVDSLGYNTDTGGSLAGRSYLNRQISRSWAYGTGSGEIVTSFMQLKSTVSGIQRYPVLLRQSFNNPMVGQAVRVGDSVFVLGSQIYEYDRQYVAESGFESTPDWGTTPLAQSATGGALTNGTYGVILAYVYVDANGESHISQPSTTETITLTGGGSAQKITVTMPVAPITLRETAQTKIGIAIYRTEVDGSVFYLDKITDTATTTVDLVQSDTNLSDNALLYTTGGVLPHYPPSASRFLAVSANRLFSIDAESKARIIYAKRKSAGLGVSWVLGSSIDLVTDLGKANALAVMDGRIIVFFDDGIAYFQGDGPNDLGQGFFSPPQTIATKVGCQEPASVVVTELGTFFKSSMGGIYLIGRGMELSYVGNGVENYTGNTIIASFCDANKRKVRFLIDDEDTALLYDLKEMKWSVFSGYSDTDNVVDMIESGGTVYWLTDGARVYSEGTSGYIDGTTVCILASISTPWYKVAGIEGFQRIYEVNIAGQRPIAGTEVKGKITLKIYYDYDDTTAAQTMTQNVADNPGDEALTFTFKPTKQKCSAIRFDIIEGLADSTTCAAHPAGVTLPKWTTLTLEVGVKTGINRGAQR